MDNKVKLFKTVADIYNRGDIELSASDRAVIENETKDLIRRSMFRRHAMKMPEGFEKVLEKLKKVESPEDAFEAVVDFLKEEGILKDKEEKKPEKDEKPGKKEKPDFDKPEKPEAEKPEKPEAEKKMPPFEKKDEEKAIEAARKAVIDMGRKYSQDFSTNTPPVTAPPSPPPANVPQTPEMVADEEDGKGLKKRDRGESKLRKIREVEKEDKVMPSVDEMGLDRKQMIRSRKARILITSEGNLVARHADRGPVFIGVPNEVVKKSRKSLIRLANKVKALIVYEGWQKAAELCGARMLHAGADDDVQTVTDQEVPPASEPVTEGGDVLTEKKPEDAPGVGQKVTDGIEVVTDEKPNPEPRMSRSRRRKVLRGGIADEAQTTTKEKLPQTLDELNVSVANDGEDLMKKNLKKPADSALDGGDVVFRTAELERKYAKLYQARAEKAVQEEVENFARKFAKCLKIASARMKLNHQPHEFKAAVVNVLTDGNSIQFSNGDSYRGMDEGAAVELTELIASEGHDQFVEDLLAGTSDLLEKDASYLDDVEKDLQTLIPVIPNVGQERISSKAVSLRSKIAKGNLEKGKPTAPASKTINIGDALSGSTQLGRRLGKIAEIVP